MPESLFSQRLILIWFAYTFEALKAFHCGQIVSNTVFEDGKRKLCPNVSTIESKKQCFFQLHSLRIQTTLNLLQKHISYAIFPHKKMPHTHICVNSHECVPPHIFMHQRGKVTAHHVRDYLLKKNKI